MYSGIEVKQYSKVTYLGCLLDKPVSEESMGVKKINQNIKFLYGKKQFLPPKLQRLLCNAIMQPRFDYVLFAWYPNLTQKLKHKLQVIQTKCICFIFYWTKCAKFLIKNL